MDNQRPFGDGNAPRHTLSPNGQNGANYAHTSGPYGNPALGASTGGMRPPPQRYAYQGALDQGMPVSDSRLAPERPMYERPPTASTNQDNQISHDLLGYPASFSEMDTDYQPSSLPASTDHGAQSLADPTVDCDGGMGEQMHQSLPSAGPSQAGQTGFGSLSNAGSRTETPEALKDHARRLLNPSQPHDRENCPACLSYDLSYKSDRTVIIRRPSGELDEQEGYSRRDKQKVAWCWNRRYQCTYCEKLITKDTCLRDHVQRRHNVVERNSDGTFDSKKWWECPTCGKVVDAKLKEMHDRPRGTRCRKDDKWKEEAFLKTPQRDWSRSDHYRARLVFCRTEYTKTGPLDEKCKPWTFGPCEKKGHDSCGYKPSEDQGSGRRTRSAEELTTPDASAMALPRASMRSARPNSYPQLAPFPPRQMSLGGASFFETSSTLPESHHTGDMPVDAQNGDAGMEVERPRQVQTGSMNQQPYSTNCDASLVSHADPMSGLNSTPPDANNTGMPSNLPISGDNGRPTVFGHVGIGHADQMPQQSGGDSTAPNPSDYFDGPMPSKLTDADWAQIGRAFPDEFVIEGMTGDSQWAMADEHEHLATL